MLALSKQFNLHSPSTFQCSTPPNRKHRSVYTYIGPGHYGNVLKIQMTHYTTFKPNKTNNLAERRRMNRSLVKDHLSPFFNFLLFHFPFSLTETNRSLFTRHTTGSDSCVFIFMSLLVLPFYILPTSIFPFSRGCQMRPID